VKQLRLDLTPLEEINLSPAEKRQILEEWSRYFKTYDDVKVHENAITVRPNVYDRRSGHSTTLSISTVRRLHEITSKFNVSGLVIASKKSFRVEITPKSFRNFEMFNVDEESAEVYASKVALAVIATHQDSVVFDEVRRERCLEKVATPDRPILLKPLNERVREELEERGRMAFQRAKAFHALTQKLEFLRIPYEYDFHGKVRYFRCPVHELTIKKRSLSFEELLFLFDHIPHEILQVDDYKWKCYV